MSDRPRAIESLESRVFLSFSANINFQPGGAAPAGYLVDKGEGYGTRVGGYTYGWNIRNTANIVQRNSPASPDFRYDTVGLMQPPGVTWWQIIVPNGTYTVHIVAGDPTSTSGNIYKINAENVTVVNGTPTAAKPWVEGTANVTVADGRLTLTSPAGAVGNRIAFLDITDATDPTPPPPPPPPPPPTGDTVDLEFNAAAGGVSGSGFAGALASSKGKGLISGNVSIGNGQLRLTSTAGDATKNTQDNALDVGYDTTRDVVTTTRLTSYPFTKNWSSAGLFIGTNEDNYVKLVAGYSGGNAIQFAGELGAVFTSPAFANFNPSGFTSLDLRLRGKFSTKTVTAEYRLNSSDDTKWVSLGSLVNSAVFSTAGKAGVLSTNFGSSSAVTTSFNWFTIGLDTNVTPPPPPPPPPDGTPITIGTNLDGLAEYSPIAPFIDLTTMFKPWGSVTTPYTTDPTIPTDANNYPLADAGTITYANGYPDGDYHVSYQGQANISFSGLNATFQITGTNGGVTTGILHLEPVSHPGTLALYVTGINAANPLHDLHIISPDANLAISDTFRPVFLQKLAPYDGYLRMMDWMQTYGSPVATWSDRTLPTRFSYLAPGGVPYEVIAKLANTVHKDPWICIPVKADDDYVHKIAQIFANNLDADRKVYVENSNELWAYWAQPDAMVELAKAQADPAITKTDPWGQTAQENGKRLVEISNIFKQEFGGTNWAAQVRPILGGLIAGSTWGDIGLQYINDHYGQVKNFISAYAIGDYVGVVNDFAPVDDANLTLDKLFSWANNFVDTTLAGWIKDNKAIADKWGVPLDNYEGGQAFAAPNGVNESIKRAAQDDPRMGDLYKHLIRSWTTLSGGGVFESFALANQYSQYGYWGVLQNIMQPTSVKYEAIKELVNDTV